jgi:glycosyltransferase involved in cell wall biosynthesis
MPKVSVIVPTRNRAHFLKATIQSILSQTFQDFEVIIVNDASTDETDDVIQGFSDSRITSIRHEKVRGQGVTRNQGINRASGEYVAFLDDDDEWLPLKLEKQVYMLDSSPPPVGLIYTGFYRVEIPRRRILNEVIPHTRGKAEDALRRANIVGGCSTVLMRKLCFDRIGLFDESLTAAADYDLWLRVSEKFDIDCISEPLVYYAVHDDRISTNHEAKIRGLEVLLNKHASTFELDIRNYSRRYSELGSHYCLSGRSGQGRKALWQAIKLYPFEIWHYGNLLLSLLGAGNFRRGKRLKEQLIHLLR